MFKQRPSPPRYILTYDVAKVLKYMNNSQSKMSLECLAKKLARLMCKVKWTKIANFELIK